MRSKWNGEPPTGKSFRFVRACERACGRGEATWAGERNDSAVVEVNSGQMSADPRCVHAGARGVPLVSRGVGRRLPGVSRQINLDKTTINQDISKLNQR